MGYNPPWLNGRGREWLGQRVRFRLFGQWHEGTISEIEEYAIIDYQRCMSVKIWDGNAIVKVTAPYQRFQKITEGRKS